ncbi:alpha/beta hydrolase [Luteimonas sp. e5]
MSEDANGLPQADGTRLHLHHWSLPDGRACRGRVLIAHGLGEHAARHERLAQWLVARGFAVHAHDHYGHGRSTGARGRLDQPLRLRRDLLQMIERVRTTMPAGQPLILFGHSMGGLVAADAVGLAGARVDGLVLSSPALATRMRWWQRRGAALLARIAPRLAFGNGLPPKYLSHDAAVVAAYEADPLCHDRISGRLAHWIADSGPQVVAVASGWSTRTLLLFAGDDHLVDPDGSRRFAAAAPADRVSAVEFPQLYHELFNEAEAAPVYAALGDWLDRHFA